MNKSVHKELRREMQAQAEQYLNRRIGMHSTVAQIRAAARKLVDMALAQERTQHGS